MTKQELKRCPFCGGEVDWYRCSEEGCHLIECKGCGFTWNKRAGQAAQWISVEDRLPSRDMAVTGFEPVLVANDGNCQWAMFNKKTGSFLDANYTDITRQTTHWMPLPTPPESE